MNRSISPLAYPSKLSLSSLLSQEFSGRSHLGASYKISFVNLSCLIVLALNRLGFSARSANFSVLEQAVNILGFVNNTVSVTTAQSYWYSTITALDTMYVDACD